MGVLADARLAVQSSSNNGTLHWSGVGDPVRSAMSATVVESCNELLRDIMSDKNVSFEWVGRNIPDKVAIIRSGQLLLPSLNALSAGQSILLGMFGTILRYGDLSQRQASVTTNAIEGICIIDEIDAHLHVELQFNTLPKLTKLFPRVQFILSSHSPLFLLGMEREYGINGIQIIEMPTGASIKGEAYTEFGKAVDVVAATAIFTAKIVQETQRREKPIVYMEGETDAPYL